VLQQVTGQPNILYYAEDLFQAVGFCGDVLSAMAAIGDSSRSLFFFLKSQNSQMKTFHSRNFVTKHNFVKRQK
jgi:hypothetical protein